MAGHPKVAAKKKIAAKKKTAPTLKAAASQPGPGDVVPIPPKSTFNQGLTSASETTMLQLLGVPGAKTKKCGPVTGAFKARIVTSSVGPFRVTGLDVAVASLKAVFDDAKAAIPGVVAAVKSDGMVCVRHKGLNADSFSNHSWGTAIDLFYRKDAEPQGSPNTDRGNLQLAPFFNKHGWYWGAGFSGKSVDSMHFEMAEETVRKVLGAHS